MGRVAWREWLPWLGATRKNPLDAQLNVYNVAAMLAPGTNSYASIPTTPAMSSASTATTTAKVGDNVRRFHAACPAADVHFIATVTRLTLTTLEDLVRFGLDLGVSRFVLREVFYHPGNNVVDHARMPELLLRPGEYMAEADRLRGRFGDQAFEIADEARLAAAEQRMLADSLRTVPLNQD
jgi:hypothetical protein